MQIVKTRKELANILLPLKQSGKVVGFVPTMGALHAGHISLVSRSKAECNLTVASIFVNPTQFNDPGDLERYPRDVASDAKMLEAAGCDVLYTPEVSDIYPNSNEKPKYHFANIDKTMEGACRPGHFDGVAQVVTILFDIAMPDKAYFGQKDFQQLAIVKHLTTNILQRTDLEIIPCPTVREPNGLAMSSRNKLLTASEYDAAAVLHKALQYAREKAGILPLEQLKAEATAMINANPVLRVEYFEIVDSLTLNTITNWNEPVEKVACVAAYIRTVRLIDNIAL